MSSYKSIAQQIVNKYLEYYGVTYDELNRLYGNTGRAKLIRGVHLDTIRMSLSFYLSQEFPLALTQIRDLVGYRNHSTICQSRTRVRHYIATKDKYFYPYWEKLLEIADPLNPKNLL